MLRAIPGVRYENVQDYITQRVLHFEKNLYHGGKNGAHEVRCFSRFTVLLEYMRRKRLKRVAYADSDVAVTSNLTTVDSLLYSDKELVLMWFPPGISGHLSVYGREGLEDFVSFFESLFIDGVWKGHDGVVQDMQVLSLNCPVCLPCISRTR